MPRFVVPLEWFIPMGVAKKSSRRFSTPNVAAHSFCPQLGVTMFAGGRYFSAAPPRIESVVGPLNLGVPGHVQANISTHRIRARTFSEYRASSLLIKGFLE